MIDASNFLASKWKAEWTNKSETIRNPRDLFTCFAGDTWAVKWNGQAFVTIARSRHKRMQKKRGKMGGGETR